jgi:hypothetical protein
MTSRSSNLRDSETRSLVSFSEAISQSLNFIALKMMIAHEHLLYRLHHSHDEENPKGPSQGNFAQVAGRGTLLLFYLIYYI